MTAAVMRDGPGFGPGPGEPPRDHAGRGRGFMSGRGRLHGEPGHTGMWECGNVEPLID